MIVYIILAIWIIGMVIAYFQVRKSGSGFMVKVSEVVLWPLTLVFYGIYLLHKKC